MPLSYGLLDGLLHEVPVVGRFPRSALLHRGLSDEVPGVRAHLVNGDKHGAVPHGRLRHVEQKSLVENDERCVGPRPGLLVLLSVVPAGNIDPRIYIWEGKRKGKRGAWEHGSICLSQLASAMLEIRPLGQGNRILLGK